MKTYTEAEVGALIAAAFEAAASKCHATAQAVAKEANLEFDRTNVTSFRRMARAHEIDRDCIRSLTPADARKALDAMLAKARREGERRTIADSIEIDAMLSVAREEGRKQIDATRDRDLDEAKEETDAILDALGLLHSCSESDESSVEIVKRWKAGTLSQAREEGRREGQEAFAAMQAIASGAVRSVEASVEEARLDEQAKCAVHLSNILERNRADAREDGRADGVREEAARQECPALLPLADPECPYAEGACGRHTRELTLLLAQTRADGAAEEREACLAEVKECRERRAMDRFLEDRVSDKSHAHSRGYLFGLDAVEERIRARGAKEQK